MSFTSSPITAILIPFFIFPSILFSQNENTVVQEEKRMTISTGLGTNFYNRFGGGIILSVSTHKLVYSLRVINLDRINRMEPLENNNIQFNNFTEISFLAGLHKNSKYYLVALNTGLGITSWQKEVDHRDQRKNTIGLPIGIQTNITPLPFMGFGIYGFSNINREKSLSGIFFILQFGDIW